MALPIEEEYGHALKYLELSLINMKNRIESLIQTIGACRYCDSINVCNKKPRVGLFRQECKVPCKIGKHHRPPPPPPRIINESCCGGICPICGSSMKLLWKKTMH